MIESLPNFFNEGVYLLGENLRNFETSFAKFCHTNHALGVANGMDAIKLLLIAHEIGPGDDVIVPANTFIATWLAVSDIGANIIPVDCCSNSPNIDISLLSNSITNRSKAIIAVHLYGEPCNMDEINSIAKSHNLLVFEDAAQSHGAKYKGAVVGSLGDGAAFSFYPGKNLGGIGDGGGITINNSTIYEKLISLRNYGSSAKYVHEYMGINSRLDEIQAIFLNHKLKYLEQDNLARLNIASFYISNIKNNLIRTPRISDDSVSAWHLFVIFCKERDRLKSYLELHGIETLIHYPTPPHLQMAYSSKGFGAGDFPNTEKHCGTCLSLPIYPGMVLEEVKYITEIINLFK